MINAEERSLLTQTVHEAVAGAVKTQQPRAVDEALADLGWLEMLHDEPDVSIAIVFEALGATKASFTALDDVALAALGLEPRADLAVVLPAFGTWDAPGRVDAGHVVATGIATARSSTAGELVVVSSTGSELALAVVPAANANITALRGIDPTADTQKVTVETAATALTPCSQSTWDACVARSRRAIAHQTAGALRAMLELARVHALDRVQFGRPVARFQAVRHRLAEALVAVEALDGALTAAADVPEPATAALAKAIAGQSARTVATNCQQVLAGIGFTTEHAFHRYLKRTMLLDGLFGGADEIVLAIGRELLASERVPTLIEL